MVKQLNSLKADKQLHCSRTLGQSVIATVVIDIEVRGAAINNTTKETCGGTHGTGGKAAVNLSDGLGVERARGGGRRGRVGVHPELGSHVVDVAQELLVRLRLHRRAQHAERHRRQFDEPVVVDVDCVARQIAVCDERHLRVQITRRRINIA